jgi:hypothetical protein
MVNRTENIILMAITSLITITATVLIMNYAVIGPMRHSYENQVEKQSELIVELAKIQKYSIENTYTIKKPKKGSTLIISPDNEMITHEITLGLQEKMDNLIIDQDTVIVESTPRNKSFLRKIIFWKD